MSSSPVATQLRTGVCHRLENSSGLCRIRSPNPRNSSFLAQDVRRDSGRPLGYNVATQPSINLRKGRNMTESLSSRKSLDARYTKRHCLSISSRQQGEGHSSSPSSVSDKEVSHFSRLAASWWDPHGPSRLLHLMNPLRHDFIRSCLSFSNPETIENLSYLDIGCGGGIFASSAARLPSTSSVTAIDPTQSCIQIAQSHQRSDPALSLPKLRYLNCAIEELPSTVEPVDILTIFEVLEHVESPSNFLSICTKHIKPNGWLIGSTISRSAVSYITTKLIAEAPVIGVVPRGTHDWNKYINPSELQEWFDTKEIWGPFRTQGVVYIPALGWRMVAGTEEYGNYFFGIQKTG